jgi:hypothetical protein
MIGFVRFVFAGSLAIWIYASIMLAPFLALDRRPILFVFLLVPPVFLVSALLSLFPFRGRGFLEGAAFFLLFATGLVFLAFVIHEQEPSILIAFLPLAVLALLWKKATDRLAKSAQSSSNDGGNQLPGA